MFILFYPMVVVVAMFGGWGPGLLATGLTLVVVDCWLYPPAGGLFTAAPVERLAMVLFACNGSLITLVAELFRRAFPKATAYDREQVLRQVRQEKQFLARLLEDAQQPFAVGYPDGRLGLMNRAYEQLTGYCAAELRTLDWSTVMTPPEWREPERRMLEELTHTGQPVRYEKEYLRKDGSRVPVELLVHLKSDASGQPEFYYSFITDITTRKQAEEALRQSEERFRCFFDSAPLGKALTTVEGFQERVNPALCQLLGYSPEELQMLSLTDITHPDDVPISKESVRALLAGE